MVTGYNICPICKKKYSPKNESILKIDTGIKTEYSNVKIYNHICMKCFAVIKNIDNLKEMV